MNLGNKIKRSREDCSLTQGQLAKFADVSQGYLSQLENGDVKNPSAAVLLRVAKAMKVEPDQLFEAAGYPTIRTLKRVYQDYASTIDPELLRFLTDLPRDRQRRLLALLSGIEGAVNPEDETDAREPVPLTVGIGLARLDN